MKPALKGSQLIPRFISASGSRMSCIFYNPEIVIIGGGVMQMGDMLFKPLIETVHERAMPAFWDNVPIVPTALGGDIGLYGSIALVLQNFEEAKVRKQELIAAREVPAAGSAEDEI